MPKSFLRVFLLALVLGLTACSLFDDPIDPDVQTATPLEEAVAWIQGR